MFSYPLSPDAELRLLEPRHADELFTLVDSNREYLRKWMAWVDATASIDNIHTFIRNSLQQFAENKGFHSCIWYRGQLAGVVGMQPINWTNRRVEIGYWLGAQFQDKGLMTMSCRAIIGHLFREYGLNRIDIRVAAGNTRSRAVVERLSFSYEGTLRQAEWLYDHFVDLEMFGLLRIEWEKQLVVEANASSAGFG